MRIAVLGVAVGSNWFSISIPGVELDLFTAERDMLDFDFGCPVIAHPPCAQWSRLRAFSKPDSDTKALAFWCKLAVDRCGGILEHPHGSLFMRQHVGYSKCSSVNQSWFGFPGRKPTLLYCNKVRLLSHPLSFDVPPVRNISDLSSSLRSLCSVEFNTWLALSVAKSFGYVQ